MQGTNLAFGLYLFKDGYAKVNETSEAVEAIKWAANYVMNVKGTDRVSRWGWYLSTLSVG